MEILKYTDREGGEYIIPTGDFNEEMIKSMPLHFHYKKGWLWGFVHSYIRKDNKRFDAYNHMLNKIRRAYGRPTPTSE